VRAARIPSGWRLGIRIILYTERGRGEERQYRRFSVSRYTNIHILLPRISGCAEVHTYIHTYIHRVTVGKHPLQNIYQLLQPVLNPNIVIYSESYMSDKFCPQPATIKRIVDRAKRWSQLGCDRIPLLIPVIAQNLRRSWPTPQFATSWHLSFHGKLPRKMSPRLKVPRRLHGYLNLHQLRRIGGEGNRRQMTSVVQISHDM